MKKLYIFLIAMISVSGIFAQNRGGNDYQKNSGRNNSKDWTYTNRDNRNGQQNDQYRDKNYPDNNQYKNHQQPQFQEKDRRAAIDRVNHDYDQRINGYRNDRSMKPYERDRRIAEMQRERTQKINSFGKGIITGAIVGLLAGVLFSN